MYELIGVLGGYFSVLLGMLVPIGFYRVLIFLKLIKPKKSYIWITLIGGLLLGGYVGVVALVMHAYYFPWNSCVIVSCA